VKSLDLLPENLERHNLELQAKFREIEAHEVRWAGEALHDAEIAIVAYGTAARVARTAIQRARNGGLRAGLFRPISLWPFPYDELRALAKRVRAILVVELSAGQMLEDVKLGVEGITPVAFHGRMGGMVPSPGAVVDQLRELWAITDPVEPGAERGDKPPHRRRHRHHETRAERPPIEHRHAKDLLDDLVDVDIADALTEVWR
jgi:2-oxoglutarate ferredoxin oxidoreductase subunit alpha